MTMTGGACDRNTHADGSVIGTRDQKREICEHEARDILPRMVPTRHLLSQAARWRETVVLRFMIPDFFCFCSVARLCGTTERLKSNTF